MPSTNSGTGDIPLNKMQLHPAFMLVGKHRQQEKTEENLILGGDECYI